MNKLSSTSITVIASTVAGHVLFSLQYPDAWILGFIGLVIVISVYIAISRRTSSTTKDVEENLDESGIDNQEGIGKEKVRSKSRFIKVTF